MPVERRRRISLRPGAFQFFRGHAIRDGREWRNEGIDPRDRVMDEDGCGCRCGGGELKGGFYGNGFFNDFRGRYGSG
jgi:hypothetical protein